MKKGNENIRLFDTFSLIGKIIAEAPEFIKILANITGAASGSVLHFVKYGNFVPLNNTIFSVTFAVMVHDCSLISECEIMINCWEIGREEGDDKVEKLLGRSKGDLQQSKEIVIEHEARERKRRTKEATTLICFISVSRLFWKMNSNNINKRESEIKIDTVRKHYTILGKRFKKYFTTSDKWSIVRYIISNWHRFLWLSIALATYQFEGNIINLQ